MIPVVLIINHTSDGTYRLRRKERVSVKNSRVLYSEAQKNGRYADHSLPVVVSLRHVDS